MASTILTFEDRFPTRDLREHAARNVSSMGDQTMPTGRVAVGPAVEAWVHHGRWLALCPTPGCSGAEYVNFTAPEFFCCECRNEVWNHDALPVLVPGPEKRRDIEAYLRARPNRLNRNWLSKESVADLRDENRANGVQLLQEDR